MAIQLNKDTFHQFINMHELQTTMMQQKLLTSKEAEMFMYRSDRVDIDFLIATLEKKSCDAFTRFYKALKSENSHLGHQDLAEIIECECSVVL